MRRPQHLQRARESRIGLLARLLPEEPRQSERPLLLCNTMPGARERYAVFTDSATNDRQDTGHPANRLALLFPDTTDPPTRIWKSPFPPSLRRAFAPDAHGPSFFPAHLAKGQSQRFESHLGASDFRRRAQVRNPRASNIQDAGDRTPHQDGNSFREGKPTREGMIQSAATQPFF